MKLRFKRQKFQEDVVKATCDIFTGQINQERKFLVDQGSDDSMLALTKPILTSKPCMNLTRVMAGAG